MGSGPRGGSRQILGGALEVEAERRVIIESDVRTREEMAEEALEGETKRRADVKVRLGVVTKALERAEEGAEGMVEEGEWSEVQRLVAEWRIEALERMEDERLEAKLRQEDELRQEVELWQKAELRRP